jgi:hypothetical protein
MMTDREHAAFLAGLTLLREYISEEPAPNDDLDDILTGGGACKPPTVVEIDDIMRRLTAAHDTFRT